MPKESLTAAELAMLFVLMAEAREISNGDLRKLYGLSLDGERRRRLNDMKLVSSRRVGRTYVHILEDRGWARCRAELTAAPPSRASAPGRALFAVLHGLDRFLRSADLSLADVFRPEPRPEPANRATGDTEAQIRAAYEQLATRPGRRVRLADLRSKLSDVERSRVDATLIRMMDKGSIYLEAQENQQRLTQDDRDAEVRIGRRQYHFLVIG